METEIQKQISERSILKESLLDGKINNWVSRTKKIDYNELYKILTQLHKTTNIKG